MTKSERSVLMSKIRGNNTSLEKAGWKLLKEAGFRFRKNPKGIFGRPDAANKSKKLAVFFDSEFWHGYGWKNRKRDFKSNKKFWVTKIERNIARDKLVTKTLKKQGWIVVRIWSRELQKRNVEKTLNKLKKVATKFNDL